MQHLEDWQNIASLPADFLQTAQEDFLSFTTLPAYSLLIIFIIRLFLYFTFLTLYCFTSLHITA